MPYFWSPAEISFILDLSSSSLRDFVPIWATDDHCKADVKNDASNRKSKPETRNTHTLLETENKS
jgi:hypothetical protein